MPSLKTNLVNYHEITNTPKWSKLWILNLKWQALHSTLKKIGTEYWKLCAINGQFVYYLSIGSKYHCSVRYSYWNFYENPPPLWKYRRKMGNSPLGSNIFLRMGFKTYAKN